MQSFKPTRLESDKASRKDTVCRLVAISTYYLKWESHVVRLSVTLTA